MCVVCVCVCDPEYSCVWLQADFTIELGSQENEYDIYV